MARLKYIRKNVIQPILFCCSLILVTGALFHAVARIYIDPNDSGNLPSWCPPPENDNLAVVCGTVVSSKVTKDIAGNLVPNAPVKGLTVAIYEDNPLSPTGKIEGNYTNLFSSSQTNSNGQYQVVMRKVGPPNVTIHLVFLCGTQVVGNKEIDSWHNYWGLIEPVNCNAPEEILGTYNIPPESLSYIGRSDFLGCINTPAVDQPIGLSHKEEPTINNVITEYNYDHRYGVNLVDLQLPIAVPGIAPQGNLFFTSPGGLWQPDCLIRSDHGQYMCNVPACNWKYDGDQTDLVGKSSPLWNGAYIDGILCDGWPDPVTNQLGMPERDLTTRPFFGFLPPTQVALPFRRLDLRADIQNINMDTLAPMQWLAAFIGTTAGSGDGLSYVTLRRFLEDISHVPLIQCSELQKRNAATTSDSPDSMRNSYLNGGTFVKMSSPSSDLQDVYYSLHRDVTEEVCRTETGEKIKLCEIRPPWMATSKENRDSEFPFCGPFKLDSSFFPIDMVFPTGNTQLGMRAEVPNDSQTSDSPRDFVFKTYETEGIQPYQDSSWGVVPDADAVSLRSNSYNAVACAVDPSTCITPGTNMPNQPLKGGKGKGLASISNVFTHPYQDVQELIDEVPYKLDDVGSGNTSLCTVNSVYPKGIQTVEQEILENETKFDPNNSFTSNRQNLKHKAVTTSTWYMSGDAKVRETWLNKQKLANLGDATYIFPPIGLSGGVSGGLTDLVMQTMYGRDIWDSLLSIIGGDGKLHDFHVTPQDLAMSIGDSTVIGNNDWKTFGNRDQHLKEPVKRPYYKVMYPISEDTFTDFFPLPDPSVDDMVPTDWGLEGKGPSCYPFTIVAEGDICGTYRERPAKVSRTCQVNECKAFNWERTGTCTCTGLGDPTVMCKIDDHGIHLKSKDCDVHDRTVCAQLEETSTRCHSPNRDLIKEGNICANNEPTKLYIGDSYVPPKFKLGGDCNPGMFAPDGIGERGIGRTGTTAERCDVSVAGPLKGGIGCNGIVQVGDMAIRMTQDAPTYGPVNASVVGVTDKPQINLDNATTAALKVLSAFSCPTCMLVNGFKIFTMDARNTDNLGVGTTDPNKVADVEVAESNKYLLGQNTYGPGITVTGMINNTFTTPLANPPAPLEQLYYNCDMLSTFEPEKRGEIKLALTTDPDEDGIGGWMCPIHKVPPYTPVTKKTNGRPELPFKGINGNCSITPDQLAKCAPNAPQNASPIFTNQLSYAATLSNVPAAALATIMYFESGRYSNWGPLIQNDSNATKWGVPWYGRMERYGTATCNDNVWSAQGPYQMLQSTFAGLRRANPAYCEALNAVAPGRCVSASRCNFLDASVALGFLLHYGDPAASCSHIDIKKAYAQYSGGSIDLNDTGAWAEIEGVYHACGGQ